MTFPFPMISPRPVPAATLSWRTPTTTSTTDVTGTASSYTFAGVDIGTANANRVVVLGIAFAQGTTVDLNAVTIAGVSATLITSVLTGTRAIAFYYLAVPTGTTATIVVTPGATTVTRLAMTVWAIVPSVLTPLDFNSATSPATSASIVADVEIKSGGAVTAMSHASTLVTFTESWNGANTPTERDDAQLEATSTYAVCDFLTTESDTTFDLTFTPSSSTGVSSIAVSWR